MESSSSAHDHYERGRQLRQALMFEQALEAFQQAAADRHYAERAHVQMALCLKGLGRYDEAVVAFRRVLGLCTFSSKEKAHILYLLGQTLEALGRYAEALEAYGWTRKEDPDFQDVVQRIKHLCAGNRVPLPKAQPGHQALVGDVLTRARQLKPQVWDLLGQAWDSVGQYTERLKATRWDQTAGLRFLTRSQQSGQRGLQSTQGKPAASPERRSDTRRHVRVAVRLRGHFSSKNQTVSGEGELRDLSPGGCRVTSPIAVPVGAELECCVFPKDALNPFNIEGATVRWSRPQEFGLAFTKVGPGVERKIAQLCGTVTPHGVSL